MHSHYKKLNSFAGMIRQIVFAQGADRTTLKTQRRLGFESLESRRVLCAATPIAMEAASVQLTEDFGPVQLAQIPQAPPQDSLVTPIGSTPIQGVNLMSPSTDVIFASERAFQQILSSIAEVGAEIFGRVHGDVDVDIFGEGEDPVPTNPPPTNPPPTNPPPTNPPPDSASPEIIEFQSQQDGNSRTFSGTVIDDKDTQGLVVTFGGLLNGSSCTVDSNGHFLFVTIIPLGSSGTVTAQTTDGDGNASNVARVYI